MIIQDPLDFFKTPEHIVTINLVDTVNRFTNMIEDYLVDVEPSYVSNNGSVVILKKSDKFTNSVGEVIAFEDFYKLTGQYFINDNSVILNSNYSRKYYRNQSEELIAKDILIAFVKDDIAKRSNWETVYDIEDAIKPYIREDYDIREVVDYITQRIDPFIISIIDHYYDKDWNIHEVEYDGFRLTLKRYGDWRAYMWNQHQYEKQQTNEHN